MPPPRLVHLKQPAPRARPHSARRPIFRLSPPNTPPITYTCVCVCARLFARAAGILRTVDLLRLGTDPSDQPHGETRDTSRPDDVVSALYTAPPPDLSSRRSYSPAPAHSLRSTQSVLALDASHAHVHSAVTYAVAIAIVVGLCITHTASLHSRDHQQGRGRVQRASSSGSAPHAYHLLDITSHPYRYYATAK